MSQKPAGSGGAASSLYSSAASTDILSHVKTLVADKLEQNSAGTQALSGNACFVTQGVRIATISVLLVDDHALMREGLRQLLDLETDMRVIDEAVDGFDAIRKIRNLQPDVVLMDIHMPALNGLAVTRQMMEELPTLSIIVLTMHREQQQVVQAISSGAKGYLLKTASSQEVAQAIRMVSQGNVYFEPSLTHTIVSEFRRLAETPLDSSHHNVLTDREIKILRCVAAGMSNKEIADQLAYAEKTVKNYLSVIFQKLGLRDRTQAAIFALRQGFLPEE